MAITFKSQERLKSRKLIEQLVARGSSFYIHPIRVIYIFGKKERDEPLQVAFSVSRRKFKHAVDRNTIKRRMREAWRHNKQLLREKLINTGLEANVLLIYSSNSKENYQPISEKILLVLKRLIIEAEQFNTNEITSEQ